MTPKPLLTRIVLAASALSAPLWAETPLFTDGTAFGGSKVFSEGINPLGNSARFKQAPNGYYFTFVDGDQRAKDNKSILGSTATADPSAASSALVQLGNAPWALRTRAYGMAATKDGANLALTREELNGMVAYPDLANLGAGLGANSSVLDGRRAIVDRLSIGGGGTNQQGSTTAVGANLRIERWAMGQLGAGYAFGPGFGSADSDLMGATGTSHSNWNVAMDAGLILEVAQGVRVGITVDQLNPRHLQDVYLQPQFRAGLQLDLGQMAKIDLETDINAVERMPFPVKQQTSAASLRFALSQAATLLVGAEQKKIDGVSTTRGGATLQVRTSSLMLGFGFQAGQDRPMKSMTLMVN